MKNNLRQLRDQHDYSQTDLANYLKVSRQTVYSIETGKFIPSTVLALKIGALFNLKVEDIFILEEND
jgi:putative transcriptional regulator